MKKQGPQGLQFKWYELKILLASMNEARKNAPPGNFMSTYFYIAHRRLKRRVALNDKILDGEKS